MLFTRYRQAFTQCTFWKALTLNVEIISFVCWWRMQFIKLIQSHCCVFFVKKMQLKEFLSTDKSWYCRKNAQKPNLCFVSLIIYLFQGRQGWLIIYISYGISLSWISQTIFISLNWFLVSLSRKRAKIIIWRLCGMNLFYQKTYINLQLPYPEMSCKDICFSDGTLVLS